jgi:ATP-dependent exoDNAse (exonuclease V) alpha subunit
MKHEDLLFQKIADNPQMTAALKAILNRENIFIHGRAGSGKSWFIKNILKETLEHTAYLSLTNIAAINIGGQTVYKFINATIETMHMPISQWKKSTAAIARRNAKNLSALVIDEVSMMRADLFDALNLRLQELRKSHEPFGGLQIILIGDLYQLPPVIKEFSQDLIDRNFFERYPNWKERPFFFGAEVFELLDLKLIELTKIYRSADRDFTNALNIVRENDGQNMHKALTYLNAKTKFAALPEIITAFCPYRKMAEFKNETELKKLNPHTEPSVSKAECSPEWEWRENEQGSNLPAPEVIKLKAGAPVIFIKNDDGDEKTYVNSYTGKVLQIDEDENKHINAVQVHIFNTGKKEWIYKSVWYKTKIDKAGNQVQDEEKYYKQFPFQLAWAMTIHKAQGLTLDNIFIDLGRGSFAAGQTYVALSRLRDINGLYLAREIKPSDVKVSASVKDFLENFTQKTLF